MQPLLKKHAEKVRYGFVGLFNTLLDFGILFILVHLGLDKIPSNYISTFVAFIFSFFINKSFTFKSKSGNIKKQFTLFFIVTLFGLWVLQPLVITSVTALINPLHLNTSLVLLIAKIIATGVSLVWNYFFYSRYVFKKEQ